MIKIGRLLLMSFLLMSCLVGIACTKEEALTGVAASSRNWCHHSPEVCTDNTTPQAR